MKALALLIVLAVAQALLRPEPAPGAAADLGRAFPSAVQGVLLGGFRPMLLRYLWWQLDGQRRDGRYAEVVQTLHWLREVDPANGRAARYLALFLAFDVAVREASSAARDQRLREAIEIVERTMRTLPKEPSLPLVLTTLLRSPLAAEGRFVRSWTERRGESPLASALGAARRARELDPGSRSAALRFAETARLHGIERYFAGDGAGAGELLLQGRRALADAGIDDHDPLVELATSWRSVLAALFARDLRSARTAVEGLAAALRRLPDPRTQGTGEEEALARSILWPVLDLGRSPESERQPDDALSLLVAGHSMARLLDERLDDGGGTAPESSRYLDAVRAAVTKVIERFPNLRERLPPSLLPR